MIVGYCYYCKKEYRKRERTYKFCSLICANNFNRNGMVKISLPEYNEKLAELVGILLGDGHISKYQTSITLNSIADKDYLPYVLDLAESLFSQAKTSIIYRRSSRAIDIRINSIKVADFFHEMGIRPNNKKIPEWIYSRKEFRKACVRGLVDTEGSTARKIYLSKSKGQRIYYQLNFRNYEPILMSFVKNVLTELKIKSSLIPLKSLYISNPMALGTFLREIGCSNPKLREVLVVASSRKIAKQF